MGSQHRSARGRPAHGGRHGIKVSERTVRGQLRRAGLHREALAAEPKAYGRYEAARPGCS